MNGLPDLRAAEARRPSAVSRIKNFFSALAEHLHIPVNVVCVFLLVLGSMYMLITAQGHQVSHGWLVSVTFAASLLAVLLYSAEYSAIVEMLIALVLAVMYFVLHRPMVDSFRTFCAVFLPRYGLLGRIKSDKILALNTDATLFFAIAAVLAAVFAARYMMRSGSLWLSAALPIFMAASSGLRYTQLCSTWAVFAAVLSMLLMVLTYRIRRVSPEAATQKLLILLLPVLISLLAVTWAIGPSGYSRPLWTSDVRRYTDRLVYSVSEKLNGSSYAGKAFNAVTGVGLALDDIDLNELSPLTPNEAHVMHVMPDYSGDIYLRAMSYGDYSNGSWKLLSAQQAQRISELVAEPLSCPSNSDAPYRTGQLEISTYTMHEVIYTSYNAGVLPAGSVSKGDSCVYNGSSANRYVVQLGSLPAAGICAADGGESEYGRLAGEIYLGIPGDTAEGLRQLALEKGVITPEEAEAGKPEDIPAVSERIKELVSSAAYYSLESGRAPENEDFALWFLTQAESGYCVHFASSAVLMFRAVGIPARLVTGFLVNDAQADSWSKVTGNNAHAWVEIYDPQTGWVLVEPTPPPPVPVSGTDASVPSVSDASPSPEEPAVPDAPAADASPSDIPAAPSVPFDGEDKSGSGEPPPAPTSPYGVNVQQTTCGTGTLTGILLLACAALAVMLWLAIRRSTLQNRSLVLAQGDETGQVLAIWDYLQQLEKVTGLKTDSETYRIMQKARFSPHPVTQSELAHVREDMNSVLSAVKAQSSPLQELYYRYIRFLY